MKFTLCVAVCVVFIVGSVFTSASDAARLPRAAATARSQTSAARRQAKPVNVSKPAPFKPVCAKPNYPTPAPTAKLGIDAQCPLGGSGAGPEAQQNMSKNDFCAAGKPQLVTIADLTKLQAQVEKNPAINFGNENKGTRKKGPTTNRAPLQKLGEGKLVTFKGFVLIARQEGPESVNCGANVAEGALLHDIHISLVESTSVTEECAGVVAEMSPHHRPDAWTHGNVEKVATLKLPVRVTGHLYFDSSHFPCTGGVGAPGNPKRVSLWEIHPIYKFEVCTANCDGAAGTWLPLDQWAAKPATSDQ